MLFTFTYFFLNIHSPILLENKVTVIAAFLSFLSFSSFKCPTRSVINKVARAIIYTHQTSSACAGVCACNYTHQMEETVCLLKVNNRNTRTRCEICSKLIIKTYVLLVSLLLTLNIFHTLI